MCVAPKRKRLSTLAYAPLTAHKRGGNTCPRIAESLGLRQQRYTIIRQNATLPAFQPQLPGVYYGASVGAAFMRCVCHTAYVRILFFFFLRLHRLGTRITTTTSIFFLFQCSFWTNCKGCAECCGGWVIQLCRRVVGTSPLGRKRILIRRYLCMERCTE